MVDKFVVLYYRVDMFLEIFHDVYYGENQNNLGDTVRCNVLGSFLVIRLIENAFRKVKTKVSGGLLAH